MEKDLRKALRLEYFTVGYNLVEALVSILAGVAAGSVALIGFGLDSIVESLSGSVLIWRLRGVDHSDEEREARLERRASRFVGLTFFILGLYVLFESVSKILRKEIPDPSLVGIVIALLSLIIMPLLGSGKMKIGRRLEMRSLIADAKETFACSFLSAALFIGLGMNYLFGFWLADPIVGLVVVYYLAKEGYELLFEEEEEE